MPGDVSQWLFALAWFAAGFVNGVSGMGAAMVALPMVAGVMAPQTLVPATCACVGVISAAMAAVYWRHCRPGALMGLFLGSVPGALAGLAVLLVLPAWALQLAAGAVMLLFACWQISKGPSQARGDTLLSGSVAGFFSGFANASISFANPPVAIYALHAGWTRLETFATLNIFTLGTCAVTALAHAGAGLYTFDVARHALFGAPATVLGMLAALPVARCVRQELFRKILLAVIACAGAVCCARGIAAIAG